MSSLTRNYVSIQKSQESWCLDSLLRGSLQVCHNHDSLPDEIKEAELREGAAAAENKEARRDAERGIHPTASVI